MDSPQSLLYDYFWYLSCSSSLTISCFIFKTSHYKRFQTTEIVPCKALWKTFQSSLATLLNMSKWISHQLITNLSVQSPLISKSKYFTVQMCFNLGDIYLLPYGSVRINQCYISQCIAIPVFLKFIEHQKIKRT